ncbi:putative conserved membrane protein [Synechococcus sp. BMK-MC-1]|nr:putative conserved membrane protein [Synechococcus sp. BMK-MC-1]
MILEGHRRWLQSQQHTPVPRVSLSASRPMILPPLSMDLGLLMISIGAVNLWRARQKST